MARRLIGLDVGSYSVKVSHLESSGRSTAPIVVAYAEKVLADYVFEPSKEGEESVIYRQQKAALLDLKAEGFFEDGVIITGLSGVDAQVRSLAVPFSSAKKIQSVLGGLLDAQLPFEIDDLVTSWMLQKSPAKSAEAEVLQNKILLAFAKKESVKKYLNLLRETGADPKYLTHKAAALIDVLQLFIDKFVSGSTDTFAMVDLGNQSTSICVGTHNKLLLARTILRGEQSIYYFLAHKLNLPLDEVQKQKWSEGMIESDLDKAKLLKGHLMSEALKESYNPIIRELRQTNLALVSQGEKEISQIFLVGEGSQLRNLENYFFDMLRIPTLVEGNLGLLISPKARIETVAGHSPIGMQAALATSYALYGCNYPHTQEHFNLRQKEFAWRGEFSLLRKRMGTFTVWGMILFVLLFGFGFSKNSFLQKELSLIQAKEIGACKNVVGKKVDSGSKCLSLMKAQIAGDNSLKIPEFSAAEIYLKISEVLPNEIQVKASEIDINDNKIRINGETSSFETVDKIVVALEKIPCINDVDKGKATQNDSFVRFQITANLNCDAASKIKTAPRNRKRGNNK